jgi:hypothetical protein
MLWQNANHFAKLRLLLKFYIKTLKAAALWNNLPPLLKMISSESLFKQRLKIFLLSDQL